jgi:hypothetical protein
VAKGEADSGRKEGSKAGLEKPRGAAAEWAKRRERFVDGAAVELGLAEAF